MGKYKLASLLFAAAAVALLFSLACGARSSSSTNHQLVSITVGPAPTTSNGLPQFVATGHYNTPPLTQQPPTGVHWGTCDAKGNATTEVTVTQNGTAQCAAGATGTYSVWADAPPLGSEAVCNAVTACGGGCLIVGSAKLTCP